MTKRKKREIQNGLAAMGNRKISPSNPRTPTTMSLFFASISGSDLKKEVARNVLTSMKTDTVDIFISGPFRNVKSGKSSWIVVFGDYGSAWTLKSQFIKGYIGTLLTKVNRPNIDTGHSSSYYDINIRKYEYGEESVWKRKEQNKTTKRLSLVYTCDSNNEKNGKLGLIEAVEFLFWSMKKREINPIGCLVVEFLKEHASALYSYLLKKKRMRTWSLKTSRLILISISVLDLLFIGMIVLIIRWWIMTLFAC
jgi:hypothetical protein